MLSRETRWLGRSVRHKYGIGRTRRSSNCRLGTRFAPRCKCLAGFLTTRKCPHVSIALKALAASTPCDGIVEGAVLDCFTATLLSSEAGGAPTREKGTPHRTGRIKF